MGTKAYDSFADLITFSRVSGGTALRHVGYGDELVTNGTFDTDVSGWTASTAFTTALDNNAMLVSYTTGAGGSFFVGAYQAFSTAIGRVYRVTLDVTSVNSNTGRVRIEQSPGGGQNGNYTGLGVGAYDFRFVATATTTFINLCMASDVTGSVGFDNISVKEVIFDRASDPLVLFNHPANIPRVEYAADGTRKGLLIEEQRTNLVTYSQDFTDAAWSKANTDTLTLDATGPDGVSNSAVTLVDSNAGGTGSVYVRDSVAGLTLSSIYTLSVFAKADQLSWVHLTAENFGITGDAYFNLGDGTIGTVGGGTATIEGFGGGWYRCALSFTLGGIDNSGGVQIALASADNTTPVDLDGTSSILIYGAQFEAGAFPTSYIPTNSGSTVTRSADVASMPVSAFGYNPKAGTVVVEFDSVSLSNKGIYSLDSGSSNGITALIYPTNRISYQVVSGGSFSANLNFADYAVSGQVSKVASVYAEDDFSTVLDGGTVDNDSSGAVPQVTTLRLGNYIGGGTAFDMTGHIKSIAYYPRRLSNAQIQELTA